MVATAPHRLRRVVSGVGHGFGSVRGAFAQQRAVDQHLRVRVSRPLENLPDRALLHDPPGVHDGDPIRHRRDHAEIVRDQQHREATFAPFTMEELQDLDLDGHVQRRRRLVGDQNVGIAAERGGDHHALRHAAGELEGVVPGPVFGLRDTDFPEQLHDPLARAAPVHPEMQPQRLRDLRPRGRGRVEHDLRLLEEHRDAAATDRVQLGFGLRQHVVVTEPDRAARDLEAARQEAHQRERGEALAASGLADEREHLSGGNLERHVVDERAERAVTHAEPFDAQRGPWQPRCVAPLREGGRCPMSGRTFIRETVVRTGRARPGAGCTDSPGARADASGSRPPRPMRPRPRGARRARRAPRRNPSARRIR